MVCHCKFTIAIKKYLYHFQSYYFIILLLLLFYYYSLFFIILYYLTIFSCLWWSPYRSGGISETPFKYLFSFIPLLLIINNYYRFAFIFAAHQGIILHPHKREWKGIGINWLYPTIIINNINTSNNTIILIIVL